jgi:bloom syndrome protein
MCDVCVLPKIQAPVVSDRRGLQVCKNPEKTRKRKEELSPAEAINQHAGHLHMGSPEDDDDYPVPQVRAPSAPLQPLQPASFAGVRAKPNRKATRKPNTGDDDSADALPRVANTSTVLAPIGAKTNYVGPALLRSRQLGMKRSGSSETSREGNENLKKPRSENSARYGNGLGCVCDFDV